MKKYRDIVPVVIGMGFYWSLFRQRSIFLSFMNEQGAYTSIKTQYLLALVVALIIVVATLIFRKHLKLGSKSSSRALLGVCALGSVVNLLINFVPLYGHISDILVLLRVVLFGINFVWLTVFWGLLLTERFDRRVAVGMALSFFVSFAVTALEILPSPTCILIATLAPTASALFFVLCNTGEFDQPSLASMKHMSWSIIAILSVFLIIGSVLRGFFFGGQLSASVGGSVLEPLMTTGFSALTALLIVGLFAFAQNGKKLYIITWAVFALLNIAGVFLAAGDFALSYDLGSVLFISGRTGLGFLLFTALAGDVKQAKASSLGAFSIFICIEIVSSFLSYYLVPHITVVSGLSFTANLGGPSLGLALLLIIGSFIFLMSNSFKESAKAMAPSQSSEENIDTDDLLAVFSEHYGLSKREAEVLQYIPLGHNYKKIGEILFISPNTVLAHIKSIYRKVDVHSKQELIDKIDSFPDASK